MLSIGWQQLAQEDYVEGGIPLIKPIALCRDGVRVSALSQFVRRKSFEIAYKPTFSRKVRKRCQGASQR